MAYKVWFTEVIEWYVDIDADTIDEVEDLVYTGDSEVWESKDFVNQELSITHYERY